MVSVLWATCVGSGFCRPAFPCGLLRCLAKRAEASTTRQRTDLCREICSAGNCTMKAPPQLIGPRPLASALLDRRFGLRFCRLLAPVPPSVPSRRFPPAVFTLRWNCPLSGAPVCDRFCALPLHSARFRPALGRKRMRLRRPSSPSLASPQRRRPQRRLPVCRLVAFGKHRNGFGLRSRPRVRRTERAGAREPIADFQSAARCNGRTPATYARLASFVRPADWKSATQQVGNLRYGGVATRR